jgi:hypothetical protein
MDTCLVYIKRIRVIQPKASYPVLTANILRYEISEILNIELSNHLLILSAH